MFGFPDSEKCPIDFSGGAFGAFPDALANPVSVSVERESIEQYVGYVCGPGTITGEQRIAVDKRTHRIRFENETESSVDVVIECKG